MMIQIVLLKGVSERYFATGGCFKRCQWKTAVNCITRYIEDDRIFLLSSPVLMLKLKLILKFQ